MSKRRLKNQKIRFVAIGAAVVTGGTIAAVLLPSANAAAEKTPDEIMRMCQRARVLNNKPQDIHDFNGDGISGPGFESDSCKFVQTNFETFNGPRETVSEDFRNCPPDLNPDAMATGTWSTSVGQGQGKYKVTQQGAAGGLFGVLTGAWVKHKGTLDLTVRTVTASDSINSPVPENKVLSVQFTPKMQRMTGKWVVKIDAKPATTTTNAVAEQTYEAPEVVEGPVILPGAAGAPGIADGLIETKTVACTR